MAACDGQNIGHVGESTHVGAAVAVPRRATQSIPPALRRTVLRRDAGRCRVPGCRHATFVDVHHLVPRAGGGANVAENLVILCSAHHRAIHRGELVAEGTAGPSLKFAHADGAPYGEPSSALPEIGAAACRALRLMGFREAEAKRAVARAEARSTRSVEDLIRQSLRELVPRESQAS
jgi:hypothetical protein